VKTGPGFVIVTAIDISEISSGNLTIIDAKDGQFKDICFQTPESWRNYVIWVSSLNEETVPSDLKDTVKESLLP
jgi:hypothetical protein